MRRYLLLPIAIAVLGTASAQDAATAVPIPILNPTFRVDTLFCAPGPCFQYEITGWLLGPSTVLFKAGAAQFPTAPPGGIYVAAIGNVGVLATGSILQTLGDTLKANTTYTLKVILGARVDYPFKGYVAALKAGNVTLASGNSATPSAGTFVTETITYNSGSNPAQLGKPLQIFVQSLGLGQVDVSNVSLTAN